jgi:hypothetical protein
MEEYVALFRDGSNGLRIDCGLPNVDEMVVMWSSVEAMATLRKLL